MIDSVVQEEAVRILTDLIRIDTTNPPGNETRAAEYIRSVLEREGIHSEIFEMEPGRGNLVARLKGSGKKRPLLLLGHMDVVGVERDQWTVEPFAASVKDAFIYGRGAIDDKGIFTAFLEVFLMLHRKKTPLDRDVILLAEAGEEGTPRVGIEFMIEHHWDSIDCEYALNEGGWIRLQNGRVDFVGVATTEKNRRAVKLVSHGTSGHGSMPRADNAITHLAAAVAALGNWQPSMRLNETTQAFFEGLAEISPAGEASVYAGLGDPVKTAASQEKLRTTNVLYNSMLRTSIAPTVFKGGFRGNVIPSQAEAILDIRMAPGDDFDSLARRIREMINDPDIEIFPVMEGVRASSPPSGLQTEMFLAMKHAQEKVFPQAMTLPVMLTGATDSAQLRAKGVHAYGIGPVVEEADREKIHGNDERISISGLAQFIEYLQEAVTEVVKEGNEGS